jgi:peptidoglycan endopeptidase LytF
MNRKDNMIVAVLLNALLLVVLFFTFVKKEDAQLVSKGPKAPAPAVASVPQKKAPQMVATKPLPEPAVVVPPPAPVEVVAPAPVVAQAPEVVMTKEVKKEVAPGAKTYTVQRGDSLDRIARRLNVTVDDLMRINDLVETRLTVGQDLLVPEAKVVPVPKVVESEAKYYVVRGGDNPWTIAQKNHLQVEELLRLNNMDEAKAKRLKPGDKLRIR